MIPARCWMIAMSFAMLVALVQVAGPAKADEVIGKVKSVDAQRKKVVITENSTAKDLEVTIDSSTSWIKEKKGKPSKKFELSTLKVGSEVEVTSQGTLASKVLIKAGKKKKTKNA